MKICKKGHEYIPRIRSSGAPLECQFCQKIRQKKYFKEHYEKNREDRIAKTIEWQRNNPEKYNAKSRAWCKKNLAKYNAKTAKRYAAKIQRTPPWLTKEHLKEIEKFYISAKEFGLTVDHIIPMQGKNVSGLHVPWNLRLLPASINYSKSNRLVGV